MYSFCMHTVRRLTFGITARTEKCLAYVTEMTGDSQTDTFNRAAQVYAYLLHLHSQGPLTPQKLETLVAALDLDVPASPESF